MEFDDEVINAIQADPNQGTAGLVRRVIEQLHVDDPQFSDQPWVQDEYDVLLEACALVSELIAAKMIQIGTPPPSLEASMSDNCVNMLGFLRLVEKICDQQAGKKRFTDMRSRYRTALDNVFSYKFSDGDLHRVQNLVNELREQIGAAEKLEDEHRQRLLARLEKLQAELHKKMSDLDRFWGLCGDAGVVMAKLGNDAKPIVDRIRELAGIVWNTQARAEELSTTPSCRRYLVETRRTLRKPDRPTSQRCLSNFLDAAIGLA